jgi:hypothetical protein
MPSVFVLRACTPPAVGDAFAELDLVDGDTAGRLARRAADAFAHWRVSAAQIALFAVREGRARALAAEADPAAAADILAAANRLAPDEVVEPGSWLLARVPPPSSPLAAAPTFESDVALLEDALRCGLSAAQRDAFRAREFDYARAALREGRFDVGRASCARLVAQLDGRVRTTTQRRLSSAEGGLYLDGLLAGGDARGRAADIFCAVRVFDCAVGAAKVYYASPPASGAASAADGEWEASRLLDAAAAAGGGAGGLSRACVVRYTDRFDLGRGRAALFMPLYARSLHQLVRESHVSAPLPPAFLLRVAADALRGLALLHAAGLAHCDVKADNLMFDGAGAATLIDLGAATRFGEAVREGAPEDMALGRDTAVASAAVDLACLASTLWWAARRAGAPAGMSADQLAALADAGSAAGGEPVGRAVAAILRAESAAAALGAIGRG